MLDSFFCAFVQHKKSWKKRWNDRKRGRGDGRRAAAERRAGMTVGDAEATESRA